MHSSEDLFQYRLRLHRVIPGLKLQAFLSPSSVLLHGNSVVSQFAFEPLRCMACYQYLVLHGMLGWNPFKLDLVSILPVL